MTDSGETGQRPWDDPDDPPPLPFFVDGRWTQEGIDWCRRSGERRHTYMLDGRMDLSGSDDAD